MVNMVAATSQVADLITKLQASPSASIAAEVASAIKSNGAASIEASGLAAKLKPLAEDKKSPAVRQAAMEVLSAIVEALGTQAVPYLMDAPLLLALERASDATESVRVAAEAAAFAMTKVGTLPAFAIKAAFPSLFAALTNKQKWQTKRVAVAILGKFAVDAPTAVTGLLPELVPEVVEVCGDTRPEVVKAAEEALTAVAAVVGNKDIEPCVPAIISSIARPVEVPECVHKLSSTTFVQSVERPALALMVPLLERGLKERAVAVKRRACVIIENMCKLVEVPAYAAPFLPKLLPGLDKAQNEISDPECRSVAARAHSVLLKAAGSTDGKTSSADKQQGIVNEMSNVVESFKAAIAETSGDNKALATLLKDEKLVAFFTLAGWTLIEGKQYAAEEWEDELSKALCAILAVKPNTVHAFAKAYCTKACAHIEAARALGAENDDEGEDLCNCEFSLAYGGKILLNTARLHLKKGKRYAILGPNGCGKSTLMKAIASGQLEGFPSDDEIRTAYVEHDIQGDSSDFTSAEYVLSEPRLKDGSKEEVVKMLHGMGFSDVLVESKVSALSGGWKMKLALARAMMLKPALLLLDEPSNHLSVGNVTWLVNYLTGENCKDVTSLIVSHDTGFLDRVVTDVVHYESFKLRRYKGTVQHFVKIKPEAKAYYELEAASYSFKFPEPGFLDGVNNKGKTILRMNKVGYTYPGRDKAVITDISLAISLASRVAVIGENGAGKSTCIKVLTGESTPTVGTVWKHPALRVAYVAQHAFHHIEHHLDWTPSEYIQWRYATGEDREALQKESREITEEEAKKMAEKITINGEKLVVEQITSRRKLKTSYEYEVKWVGQGVDKNAWLPRYKLEEMGFGKMCDALDAKEAAQAGLRAKPLTAANIAKHLADIGLEPEFTLHSRMRGLSGGQKLKVVIGASTWMAPHVIVLDEPSNFVDRDTLGALSQALRDFGGAVVIISHNHEFTKAICTEIWTMEHGRLTISGEVGTNAVSEKVVAAELGDEVTDAAGNVIKIAQKKKLNSKEARRKAKERAIRRKRGEEVTDTEDEEYDE